MSAWFNYIATAKILIFGLLAGASLPALFAIGVRLGDAGEAVTDGETQHPRRPALIALRWATFALLLVMVVVGMLFIARHFIENRIGWEWDV
jgi:hypothetical protein